MQRLRAARGPDPGFMPLSAGDAAVEKEVRDNLSAKMALLAGLAMLFSLGSLIASGIAAGQSTNVLASVRTDRDTGLAVVPASGLGSVEGLFGGQSIVEVSSLHEATLAAPTTIQFFESVLAVPILGRLQLLTMPLVGVRVNGQGRIYPTVLDTGSSYLNVPVPMPSATREPYQADYFAWGTSGRTAPVGVAGRGGTLRAGVVTNTTNFISIFPARFPGLLGVNRRVPSPCNLSVFSEGMTITVDLVRNTVSWNTDIPSDWVRLAIGIPGTFGGRVTVSRLGDTPDNLTVTDVNLMFDTGTPTAGLFPGLGFEFGAMDHASVLVSTLVRADGGTVTLPTIALPAYSVFASGDYVLLGYPLVAEALAGLALDREGYTWIKPRTV